VRDELGEIPLIEGMMIPPLDRPDERDPLCNRFPVCSNQVDACGTATSWS
jgi:hypothetical protein